MYQVKLFILPALAAEDSVKVVDLMGPDEVEALANEDSRKWLLYSFLKIGESTHGEFEEKGK